MIAGADRRRRQQRDADHLVETTLRAATGPLSTYEIRDRIVAGGDRISVPQVYRIVARLVAAARIRRVETLNGYIPGAGGDALAICRHCSSVTRVPIGGLMQQLSAFIGAQGFEIDDIIIEARGRCARCLRGRTGVILEADPS